MEQKNEKTLRYNAIFEPTSKEGFLITVPKLPGLSVEAKNFEEGQRLTREAIKKYIETLDKEGVAIPTPFETSFTTPIDIKFAKIVRDKPKTWIFTLLITLLLFIGLIGFIMYLHQNGYLQPLVDKLRVSEPSSSPETGSTPNSTTGWKNNAEFGPESLWTPDKSTDFIKQHLKSTPTGWYSIECEGSLNFIQGNQDNLSYQDDPSVCATEPNAFTINVFVNSPYVYKIRASEDDTNFKITNKNDRLSFSDKPAIQYEKEIIEGQGQGKYIETVIQYNDDTYIYIILNAIDKGTLYQDFIKDLEIE